jgi:hypothetical protein
MAPHRGGKREEWMNDRTVGEGVTGSELNETLSTVDGDTRAARHDELCAILAYEVTERLGQRPAAVALDP